MELSFNFLVEHVTELIVSVARMPSAAVETFDVVGKKTKMDNFPLQKKFIRITLRKYRYFGSFPSVYVPTLDNEPFTIINTQPSIMQGELLIKIANSCLKLYFADSLCRPSFLKQQHKQMMPELL